MNINKLVGNRIRAARQYRGITTNVASEDLGWNISAFSVYERARSKVSLEKLEQIAEYLKVPLEYFFAPDDKAEGMLYGTEVRTDEKIAALEKRAADAESNYNAAFEEWERVSGELHNARAANDELTARIERMKVEIDHYRNLPAQIVTEEPVEWAEMREQMRKSMEASKAILDAAIKVMEQR
jgi:transcriptional regulator with XRE-family HTH domain